MVFCFYYVYVQLLSVQQQLYLCRPMEMFHAVTREMFGPCARTPARWVTGSLTALRQEPVRCLGSRQAGMALNRDVSVSISPKLVSEQGRRQCVCLGRAKCFATAAPALRKSLSGGGGGGGYSDTFFQTSTFPPPPK